MRGIAFIVAAARRRLWYAARPHFLDACDRSGRALLRLAGWAATAARVTLAVSLTLAAAAVRP
jgi:hypothetical protein